MDKKSLSERDICSKYIAPAIQQDGWDMHKQVLEEFCFTNGRIIVRGKLHSRGEHKRADYVLSHQKNLPITTSGFFNLSAHKIRSIPVALPLIPEQHRIVAKVDQLMASCDQLKNRLTQARQLNEKRASTLVEQAVA